MGGCISQDDVNPDEYQSWLARVKKRGWDLEDAPRRLRGDKAIVMAAVEQHGLTLKYASRELKKDREVVLAAVRASNGRALQFAPPELRNDKQVVSAAVQIYALGYPLEFASPELRRDKDLVLMTVRKDANNIKYVHEDLKRDRDVMVAAGMFDEDHDKQKLTTTTYNANIMKKIAMSTRFSLTKSSKSHATIFTQLLKKHPYIRNNFIVYAPNAFDKKTCDPNWTDFDWPCRGTKETCKFGHALKTGHPTDECCWRYSFRYQLEDAKKSGGFMLQLIEKGDYSEESPTLGKGQAIERDMAWSLEMKIFHVYRPTMEGDKGEHRFEWRHIEVVVTAIKNWYDEGCHDMSECVVCPKLW